MKKVIVAGAGLAGLSAAHKLRNAGCEVVVLESQSEVGGRCQTKRENSFEFDTGAQFFSSFNTNMFGLIDKLGASDELIAIKGLAGSWRDGKLLKLRPGSLLDYISSPILSLTSKLLLLKLVFRMVVHYRQLDWQAWDRAYALDHGDAASYIRETLDEDILEYLFQPFFSGFWYAAPEELSSAFVLLLFKHLGAREFTYRGGLGALPKLLAGNLNVKLECKVQKIEPRSPSDTRLQVTVQCDGQNEQMSADVVVCALRAPEALNMLSPDFRDERNFLKNIRYGSSIVVAFPIEQPIHPDMWGILLPRKEFDLIASVVLEHAKPEAEKRMPKGKGCIVVTSSNIGAKILMDLPSEEVAAAILAELKLIFPTIGSILSTNTPPVIIRHRLAQPLFAPGHLKSIRHYKSKRQHAKSLFLSGDYLNNASTEGAVTDGLEVGQIIAQRFSR